MAGISIYYPESNTFSTAAAKWGCMYEKIALDLYRSTIEELHANGKIETCGLFLSENDPYCHKDDFIFEAVSSDKKFCLKDIGGETKLAQDHSYYYQVQAQLHV